MIVPKNKIDDSLLNILVNDPAGASVIGTKLIAYHFGTESYNECLQASLCPTSLKVLLKKRMKLIWLSRRKFSLDSPAVTLLLKKWMMLLAKIVAELVCDSFEPLVDCQFISYLSS